jgi:membrane associated rhomboid family serine protease
MVEKAFGIIFPGKGSIIFLALYIISQFLCLVPTYIKHQDDYYYRSLGASGAVCAVVFAGILLSPLDKIYIFLIPIGIPAFIFGLIFLLVSLYFDKRGKGGNFNHSAHYWGALAGVLLLVIFGYTLSAFDPVANFVYQIRSFVSS